MLQFRYHKGLIKHIIFMKNIKASTILLTSSVLYFIVGIFWRSAGELTLVVDALNILALLLLCWGAVRWQKEKKSGLENVK